MIRPESASRAAQRLRRLLSGLEATLLPAAARLLLAVLKATDPLVAVALHATALRRLAERRLTALRPRMLTLVVEAVDGAWTAGEHAADGEADRLRRAGATLTAAATRALERAGRAEQTRRQQVEDLMWRLDRAAADTPGQTARAWQRAAGQATRLPTGTALSSVEGTVKQAISEGATRRQAAQRALDRLADEGITGFVDQRGRRWELASYVEAATRSVTQRTLLNAAFERLGDHGIDLVRISDVPGECVICRPHEGKVYSLSGHSEQYPALATAIAAGLWHVNCRHGCTAYLPGVTPPIEGPTADPEGEAARAYARSLERLVRKWRRRELVALDDVAKAKATRHRKQAMAKLREHVAATSPNSLRYSQGRTQIGGAR